uniref:Malate dehydrogenase n=1 Tax=Tetraselmis sp. GSL018 TaxID=582737 RepID=A0A061QWK0_9CHLO|mmetsp:Transcript_8810/g.21280  ORF Transcript_8810/g.21280 Transcript_8810/m.21280 type:complete len:338 (+) Transcript_8810:133-1146(+)|eukprot:CAMPEP_0177613740 /NCGR_PEP_ID=MMETSP0419_2-20121207/22199_1 /TAXON_ID=582737 /ORGANISM="Tetraselmis sp., Strain GSL018" /LENGTH=337 /DNA_ID=CAMNT_0019110583 /DNA_START=89 /DNA_END=1102 /DNA_ORIENTATION=+
MTTRLTYVAGPANSVESTPTFKVAVLGAAGGIGQPLSMLLRCSPLISDLSLYDVAPIVKGVACDLSHCDIGAGKVAGFCGDAELGDCLNGCDLVIIPAGVPRKPGMTRDDLFNINAGIVRTLVQGVADHCPDALIGVISNPVNSTVPIAAEVLKKAGKYNPKKLFGVTTLDVVRANKFVSEIVGVNPKVVSVPVVGGHAGATILPLLSQSQPPVLPKLSDSAAADLTKRIQNAGTEVVEAKAGGGSATLSMAYAAARFAESCLSAMAGAAGVEEYAYVESQLFPDLPFFSSKVSIGRDGILEVHGLGALNNAEKAGLEAMKEELKGSIAKGVEFANK